MACPCGGSNNTRVLGSSKDYDYYKCTNCGNTYTERK